ncbi:MAG: S1 RNA-binding domain-containing protein [Planctomycetaceae bacterium]|nr:S1 RNA-binding domain-containing protein [Planctomycetaceae bacterium]
MSDSSNLSHPVETAEGAIENPSVETSTTAEVAQVESSASSRPRILIGSQRDPAAYRARPKRDWKPIEEGEQKRKEKKPRGERKPQRPAVAETAETPRPQVAAPSVQAPTPASAVPSQVPAASDVDSELSDALDGLSMAELLNDGSQGQPADGLGFESGSTQTGRVVAVRRDDVFVEFGQRAQGILPLRLCNVPPHVGVELRVVVQRQNPDDGLYELSLPNQTVQVDDWSDLTEGALVEVRVTGHNTGGLECEVNHIRGFIPVSQVSLYRVEDLAPYVDQRLTCVITEANPDRRNLVLSRRAVLEREKEQARQQLLSSIQPGQTFDGVVRKLMDFGAFVDLGGVDGLVHVSQLAWGRVKHPSDVLKEGQTIKVRVDRVDPETGKISLAYRDLQESPWVAAAQKYPPQSVVTGTVTKLMDFGAFVELEPGIEGLVHVSELSHKRVWRPSDVVKEGQQVEVMVLAFDASAQRISLSMKALASPPEPAKKDGDEPSNTPAKSKKHAKPTGPLVGGLGHSTGDRFGLKW